MDPFIEPNNPDEATGYKDPGSTIPQTRTKRNYVKPKWLNDYELPLAPNFYFFVSY